MDKSYDPATIESRWYAYWEEQGFFAPQGEGEPYTIMLPPPNVTGRLHMGHAFQDSIMDALMRYHRMSGRDALWQGGTDHAGIATQMVVERQLAGEGSSRHDLGREKFIERVWGWKEQSHGFVTGQLRRLGASLDWDHERFTLDEGLSKAVTTVFVDLHEKGLIYRGKRLVNWDPVLGTALSDLEVESHDEQGHLWHIRYPRTDGKGDVIVATTRPETMLGDTAVAVNPDDERYAGLVGLELDLPLTGRTISVIADDYVDADFGTGCVKITPAHDFNDYEIGQRHDLESINIMTPEATISDQAPESYVGMDRFDARKQIVKDLEEGGYLVATEKHKLKVPRGDRSGAVLEPLLTDQWFVKIDPLAKPAIRAVEDGKVKFVPENWNKTYFEWMHNIKDWCISRQLWWGHRIPAWYDDSGNIYVGHDEADARQRARLGDEVHLRQDDDVLDTWFSSALWPFSTLGWPEKTDRLERYYPTDVLVTGFDIIFFWVARMIMMGIYCMDRVPFHTVYVHGLIRDAQGQKMSKSKGNVLDPIDLIDGIDLDELVDKRTSGLMQPKMAPRIAKDTEQEFPDGIRAYGTDALRFTFLALATHGRDIRFDLGRVEGYRNFCTKIWNAARFVLMNMPEDGVISAPAKNDLSVFDRWIRSRQTRLAGEVESQFAAYRFDLAASAVYDFIWHEYCDWYLELAKRQLDDDSQAQATRYTLLSTLESALRLLHPLMPFLSEEIWHKVAPRLGIESESIMLQDYPQAHEALIDDEAEAQVTWLQRLVSQIRTVRSEMDVPPSRRVDVLLAEGDDQDRTWLSSHHDAIVNIARLDSLQWLEGEAPDQAAVALAGNLKLILPLAGLIDLDKERDRLDREIEKREDEVSRSEKKLGNPGFVENAPKAVVDQERERLEEHQAALVKLQAQREQVG